MHSRNGSRQLSAIRDLVGFDMLAAFLLASDYSVLRAALIPCEVVRKRCSFVEPSNSYKIVLIDNVWHDP